MRNIKVHSYFNLSFDNYNILNNKLIEESNLKKNQTKIIQIQNKKKEKKKKKRKFKAL